MMSTSSAALNSSSGDLDVEGGTALGRLVMAVGAEGVGAVSAASACFSRWLPTTAAGRSAVQLR